MTALRRRLYSPLVAPVAAPVAPGSHHSGGVGFATVLHAAVQELEQEDDAVRVEPIRRAEPMRPAPGPLIVAGIVVPAGLPR